MRQSSERKTFLSIIIPRIILKIFFIFPVNSKKIFFSSYEGKQFSCNPKCVYQALRKQNRRDLKFVYEYNGKSVEELDNTQTKVVRHNSVSYLFSLLTSKVIITNSGITAKIPIRKSQIVINTWHGGGAYKKCGLDIDEKVNGSGKYYIQISEKQTHFFVSSSKKFSEAMFSGLNMSPHKMLNIGMPRNDIFFAPIDVITARKEQIKKSLELEAEEKIALYAPTYRGNVGNIANIPTETLDVCRLLEELTEKFGGTWKFLFRDHYFTHSDMNFPEILNVSDYPDMQELLLIADVLITDYSSSVWDFSFTDKPGFLFVPDLHDYEQSRSFYTPIEQWPYKTAKTMDSLCSQIQNYSSEEQKERNRKHHDLLGNYENGTATVSILNIIFQYVKSS